MLLILCLVFHLSTIGHSGVFAAFIIKPGNPLNVFKKFVPKRTGILNHPSFSNTSTGTTALASTTRRTTRREVFFHSVKVKDSSPVPALVFNGDKSHREDKATHDLNVADVIESRSQTKGDACNIWVSEPRATATVVNGRALTGYPVFLKNYNSDSPGDSEKYYDEQTRPAVVWKTGIRSWYKVGPKNSAEDDEDDDYDER